MFNVFALYSSLTLSAPNLTPLDRRGQVSTTASGKPCQKWSEQYPHQHIETHPNLPRAGLGGHSYCRNPSGQQEQVRSAPAARAGLLASSRPHITAQPGSAHAHPNAHAHNAPLRPNDALPRPTHACARPPAVRPPRI